MVYTHDSVEGIPQRRWSAGVHQSVRLVLAESLVHAHDQQASGAHTVHRQYTARHRDVLDTWHE